jgi:polyhydroxyalkanoate synthesis regulator phasin
VGFFSSLLSLNDDEDAVPLVDVEGTSYRQELLRALARLQRKGHLEDDELQMLHGLLQDLHHLEYSVAQTETVALKEKLGEIQRRVDQLEAQIKIYRQRAPEPSGPGRIA